MRPEPIVSVELMGGLGNQMFQYAAGHALARRTGAALQLDLTQFTRSSKRHYLLDCFGVPAPRSPERSPGASRGRAHDLAVATCRRLGLSTRFFHGGWNVYIQPGIDYDPAFERLEPPVHLHGYFQSERFFRSVAQEIRELFALRVPVSPACEAVRHEIGAADWPVSIHVRRGDYVHDPGTLAAHGICAEPYYRAATGKAERMRRDAIYFVFSDDPAGARELLGGLKNARLVSSDVERPWEDLALMASCRGHIIANSSFSWWGAWLDPRPDKWVVAPQQWFAPAYQRNLSTVDLYPPGWICL